MLPPSWGWTPWDSGIMTPRVQLSRGILDRYRCLAMKDFLPFALGNPLGSACGYDCRTGRRARIHRISDCRQAGNPVDTRVNLLRLRPRER